MEGNMFGEDVVDVSLKEIKEYVQSLEKRSEKHKDLDHGDGADDSELQDSMQQLSLSETSSDEYNLQHSSRGLCVVFNVENFIIEKNEREGSYVDAERVVETFTTLGFRCFKYNDPRKTDMIKILKEVASLDHSHMDCVAVCILTHGGWIDYMRPEDNKPAIADRLWANDDAVRISELTELFRIKNCHPSLTGKPKFFIIQACRGPATAEGVQYKDNVSPEESPRNESQAASDNSSKNILQDSQEDAPLGSRLDEALRQDLSLPEDMPVYKDFLLLWSTPPGFISNRDPVTGSVFIQTLCRYLDEFHETEDMLSILTWVSSDIAHKYESNYSSNPARDKKKQMPWYFSRLTKDVYFRQKTLAVRIPKKNPQ